jgi:hypothetical protein
MFVDLDGVFFMGWLCDACLSTLNSNGLQAYLERKETLNDYPPESDIDPLIDLLHLHPMCAKCFEELSNETANRA